MKIFPPRFALVSFLLIAAVAATGSAGAGAGTRSTGAVAGSTGAAAISSGAVAELQAEAADQFASLRWRNIGPANMMGRIASIDALDTDHRVVLVASASGGVFLSNNAGTTWRPIFDSSDGAGSIGAAVFFQGDPDIIWVGTGEAANRNSTGYGNGVYKSTDGGRTWTHVGLESTHHVAEIATHPTDPDIAYVAAPGHLWGYSGERGLFKTTDGGATWEKLGGGLPDDGKTGCTEIIMEPGNPDVMYAGMYHRLRQPATMYSGGEAGGIFKSADAGRTWRKLTGGLPDGPSGMIDIAIHRADPQILVTAFEADETIPYDDEIPAWENIPGTGIYISRDGGESWRYLLRHHTRPFYHGQIDIDPLDPNRIYVVSREFTVSRDGGETWGNRWWGGGGDDHDLWIAPYDGAIRYTATDQGAYLTVDDGQTVLGFDNMAIGQYYAIGVDMRDPYWVIGGLQDNGIWMGPSNSREQRGILNMHNTWVAEGDGFHSQIDPTDWRTVYTVNHVGFLARQNIETRQHAFITPTPETIVNFDDYADPDYPETSIRYTISPGEHWFFRERPERPVLPPQFRFNWSSPLIISPHNPRTLYFGGNHLFKSIDRGDTWRIISLDLTTNDPELRNPSDQGGLTNSVTGGENHFTIITIAESPVSPMVLWVGTDDGNVQVSSDRGASWTNVRGNIPDIPEKIWVSRVEASHHAEGTAYVTFDNHRYDDMRPYVFKTTDFGASWIDISANLPEGGSVYVIKEDQVNPNLLFVGTEFAVFATLDGGETWGRLRANLPSVAAYDLVIHPRDADLVVGTHGRSIWILDDITPLQQLTDEVLASDVFLFESREATKWVRVNLGRKQPNFLFRGENPPYGALINFYLSAAPAEDDEVSLVVEELDGDRRANVRVDASAGINRARWAFTFPATLAEREKFAARMRWVIDKLETRVQKPELLAKLPEIRARLEAIELDTPQGCERAGRGFGSGQGGRSGAGQPNVCDQLNTVRRALAGDFAVYAGGQPFFGPKIENTIAPAGEYRILLTVGDTRVEGSLVVRDDPLVSANQEH